MAPAARDDHSSQLIDEVRLFSNFETAEYKLLQIILAGQSELNTVLGLESLRQARQRIAIRVHIDPLAQSEVKQYLQARWRRASTQHPLPFSEDAIQSIARASGGIPRIVNVICDAALVNAYGTGATSIGVSQIEEVVQDLQIAPRSHAALSSQLPEPVVPKSTAHLSEPVVHQPTPPGSTVRYLPIFPIEPKSPKIWKVKNWFRTATSEAK